MGITQAVTTVFKSKDQTSKNFKKMGKNAKKFGEDSSRAFKKLNKSAVKTSSIMKGILAAGAVSKGIGLVTRGLGSAVTEFIKFDKATLGATVRFKDIGPDAKDFEKQLVKIKDAARAAGAATTFTASQSSEALDFLAKAGFTSTEAIGSLSSMINLAVGTGEDFARVADISSDLLGAFGLSADNAAQKIKNLNRLNDVLVKTTNSANVTVETMFETMKQVGPVATGILGASLEEVAALTGVLGNSGIKGSDAMTALKNAYLRLAAPVGAGADVLKEFGITLKDGSGGVKKITDVLDELGKAMTLRKIDPVDQAKALDAILGKRAIAGGKNLLNNIKNIKKFEKELLNAGGTAKKTAKIMERSLEARLQKLNSALTDKAFTVFEQFAQSGKDGITAFTEAVSNVDMTQFITSLKLMWKIAKPIFNGIAAVVVPLVDVLGKLVDLADKIPSLPGLGGNLAPVAERKAEAMKRIMAEAARQKAAGTFGVSPKGAEQDFISSAFSDASSGFGSAKRLFDKVSGSERQAPNKTKLEGQQKVSLEGNINIAGAAKGSTAEFKSSAGQVDASGLGAN